MHSRPACQRNGQAKQATNREEHDGDNSVGLDEFFGCTIDFEAGSRAGAKFCGI